jgi:hypothetical protein
MGHGAWSMGHGAEDIWIFKIEKKTVTLIDDQRMECDGTISIYGFRNLEGID